MKKLAFVLGVLIGLASLAIAAGCGSQGAAGSDDPVGQALSKMQDAKTFHTDLDVQLTLNGDASRLDPAFQQMLPLNLGLHAQTDQDLSDQSNPKMKMTGLTIDGLDNVLAPLADNGALHQQSVADAINRSISQMSFIVADGKFYADTGKIAYEYDPGQSPAGGSVDSKCLMDALSGSSAVTSMKNALTDVQNVGAQDVNGTPSQHYTAGIDASKTAALTGALSQCSGGQDAGAGSLANLMQDAYKNAKLEFWVSNDGDLMQMETSMDIKFGDLLAVTGSASLGASQQQLLQNMSSLGLTINVQVRPSQLGQQVSIKAPSNPLPFSQLFAPPDPNSPLSGGGSSQQNPPF